MGYKGQGKKTQKQFPFQKANHNSTILSAHQLRMVEERGPKLIHACSLDHPCQVVWIDAHKCAPNSPFQATAMIFLPLLFHEGHTPPSDHDQQLSWPAGQHVLLQTDPSIWSHQTKAICLCKLHAQIVAKKKWHAQVQQLPSQFRQRDNPMHTSSHRIRKGWQHTAGDGTLACSPCLCLHSLDTPIILTQRQPQNLQLHSNQHLLLAQKNLSSNLDELTADYDVCIVESALRFVRARSDGVLDRVYMNLKARYQLSFSPGQDIELLIT